MTMKLATLAMTTLFVGASAPTSGAAAQRTDATPQLLVIDTLDIPIVSTDRVDGRMLATLRVQFRDAAALDQAHDELPHIRSRLLIAAMEFSHLHASALAPLDAQALSERLNRSTTLNMPQVERVLIVELRSSPI